MVKPKSLATRSLAAVSVIALTAVSLIPIFGSSASAVGAQVSSRSITISQSSVGATGVTYTVAFTPSATSVQSLVLDFCAGSGGSPLVGNASCTQSAADVPNFTSATVAAGSGIGAWTTGTLTTGRVKLNGTASASATPQTITINNVTNPTTTVGTFFARLTTYSDAAYGAGSPYVSPSNPGNYVDYGGFALSTTNAVFISAAIQEKLTFTVTNTAVKIGDGGTPSVIDSGAPQIGDLPVNLALSTNAINGVSVKVKGPEIKNGVNCLDGATCADTSTAGGPLNNTANNFGICVETGTAGLNVSHAGYTAATCTTASNFGFNPATYNASNGDQIYSSTGPVSGSTGSIVYGAQARLISPAGIYTASHDYIATGTF